MLWKLGFDLTDVVNQVDASFLNFLLPNFRQRRILQTQMNNTLIT
jgi:hypothetical protein